MSAEYTPTPTEVIDAWIPHDARWHSQARAAARLGPDALRRYVTGLVCDYRDGTTPLTTEYDLRSLGAVAEDLADGGGISRVCWDVVRESLLVPDRHRVGR